MADIPPLVTTPSIASKTAPLPSGEPVVIAAEIQTLPERFSQLTRPVQINGTILSLQYDRHITFHTASGNLTLKLLVPQLGNRQLSEILLPLLQSQKPLNLVIQPGNPPTQALLTLPASALQQQNSPTGAMAIQPPQGQAQTASTFAPGQIITVVVLPKGIAEAFAPATANPTAMSTLISEGLSVTLASNTAEAASGISQGGFLTLPQKWTQLLEFLKTPVTSVSTNSLKEFIGEISTQHADIKPTNQALAHQTQVPEISPGQLKPGMEWNVRLSTIIPPEVAAPFQDSPDQIVATVIGKGPDGQLLLSTGENSLFIRQNGNIPLGSKLIFTLLQPTTEIDSLLETYNKDFDLPALQKAIAALAEVEPVLAHQVMQKHIPQPNASLPTTMLFLLNALQQGSVHNWLGQTVIDRFTKMNKLELIAALADEMQQASGMARDPVIGQWRTWSIPIFDGSQFQMIGLYVRRDRDRKENSTGYPISPQTRFLININMSYLGPIQMDGLSQKKRLDMIIRSERSLPAHLPDELRALYLQNLDILGLTGSITFQTGRKHWIEVRKATSSKGMVT